MSIPSSFIDQLIDQTDIVEVIGRRLPLNKKGSNFWCLCPFHDDSNPSMAVNQDKQFFYCFVCQESGNAIHFLRRYENLEFVDAIETLASAAGMTVPYEGGKQEKAKPSGLVERAVKFYQSNLNNKTAPKAVQYLKDRNITGATAKKFNIGYAQDSWDALANYFGPDTPIQELDESGLFSKKDNRFYDRFRGRVIFPIRNIKGDFIAMGGRIIDEGEPKYLNSPETSFFNKSNELFGLYEVKELEKNIKKGFESISPFALLGIFDDPLLHYEASQTLATNKHPRNNSLPVLKPYSKNKKIRLGYFSADFREHPVSDLIVELLEVHNRDQFEIHAFSCGKDTKDKMNLRIKASVDHFHNVHMKPDKDVAILARSFEIDIAIDLGGFTQGNRTGIFAMLAAPIQVCYLGYAGTMGADYMDYLICDRIVIPEDKQNFYSENLAYLPNSYMANDSKIAPSARVFTRKNFELPDNGFVFCCFNSSYKITPETFTGWMNILSKVDGSVLWLSKTNSTAIQNLKKEAQKLGINPNRLIFASRLDAKEDHLKRIQSADLFLDTLPYNAHTTTSDALRVGLPVLTRIGESFTSRVAASLLNAVNLPELITSSQEEYEALAIELATNPDKLKIIKDKLALNLPTAPLYDTALFTQHIESAYKTMYERHHQGLKPENIYVEH